MLEEDKNNGQNTSQISQIDMVDLGLVKVPSNQKFRVENLPSKSIINPGNPKFYEIINKPRLTEKAVKVGENNCFTLLVDIKATKRQVIAVVERIFKIAVVKINSKIIGTQTKVWTKKKSKNKKVEAKKYMMVRFNSDIDIDIEKMQGMLRNMNIGE